MKYGSSAIGAAASSGLLLAAGEALAQQRRAGSSPILDERMANELQQLIDREQIRDLVSRFAAYEDLRKWDEATECFTEDGVFDETLVGNTRMVGRETIRAFFNNHVAVNLPWYAHYITGHVITEQSENEAKGFCNCFFEGELRNGSIITVHGYMDDTYARVNGRWLYKTHKVIPYAPAMRTKPRSDAATPSSR